MSRFNLLDEPWIRVITDDMGTMREVSLKEFFAHAHEYKDLAGNTKTQDFSVLRILLAVLHTVFSRFDANGNTYEFLQTDNQWKQISKIDEDDLEEYEDALLDTWSRIWDSGKFPSVVNDYLEKWRDRFWLLDDKYPFMQVPKELLVDEDGKMNASPFFGKNMNRTISESNNKVSVFSPKTVEYKEMLMLEWVMMDVVHFHQYVIQRRLLLIIV